MPGADDPVRDWRRYPGTVQESMGGGPGQRPIQEGQEGTRDRALGPPEGGLRDQLTVLPVMAGGGGGVSGSVWPDASSGGCLPRGMWNSMGDGADQAPAGAGRP